MALLENAFYSHRLMFKSSLMVISGKRYHLYIPQYLVL
jgi:hypothetical protein